MASIEKVTLSDADLAARGIDPEARKQIQAYCINYGFKSGHVITDMESYCGKHLKATVEGCVGLHVCPDCARDILFERRVKAMEWAAADERWRRERQQAQEAEKKNNKSGGQHG